MTTLCASWRERSRGLRFNPDRVLALLLLVLLLVMAGRQSQALLYGAVPGAGVQQAALDEDYVFED